MRSLPSGKLSPSFDGLRMAKANRRNAHPELVEGYTMADAKLAGLPMLAP